MKRFWTFVILATFAFIAAAQLTKPNGGGGGGGPSLTAGTDYVQPGLGTTYALAVATACNASATAKLIPLTNSFYDFVQCDGSSWDHFLNGHLATPPVDGDFAWVNQGGATVTTTNGGIFLLAPTTAGNSIRIRKTAAPSKPWTRTMAFIPLLHHDSTPYVGLAVRESSSGKLITLTIGEAVGGHFTVSLINWTNETTFSAYTFQQQENLQLGPHAWFRVANDGSNNLVWSISTDSVNFLQVASVSDTAFFSVAPDEVGFIANSASTSATAGITVLSWE